MYWKNFELHIGDSCIDAIQFGSGTEPLVLIPGLGDGLTTVRGKAAYGPVLYRPFAARYRVTVISRRRDLPEGFTTRDMARDVALAMQALGIRQAMVAGVSQGGMIAQHLAADHPSMVKKLVLAATAPCAGELLTENITRWIGFAGMGAFLGLMIDITEKAHPEKYLRKFRPLYPYLGTKAKKMNVERFCTMAQACLTHSAEDRLDRITAPTLILGGALDRTLGPEGSHELHRAIAGSELRIFENQGHALYEDEPEFNRTVLEFLEEKP